MKYRIKTVIYADNHKTYTAYKKVWLFWRILDWYGEINTNHPSDGCYHFDNRDEALKAIDKNFDEMQSKTIKSIDLDYINK